MAIHNAYTIWFRSFSTNTITVKTHSYIMPAATRGAAAPATFVPGHLLVASHGRECVECIGIHAGAIAVSQTMPRKRKSTPTTMPQTPRLARSMTRKRKPQLLKVPFLYRHEDLV
ncbi:unnamed protein product [Euphydryas editha]|uniref:Uncharacterized protein n=1 Tax=Euphydryas editha TaxID=104508 RepID=A0AAU9UUS7_EUPED|nr:unnamed protein product [Euphydryas editha]